MTPDRWKRVNALFESALEREPDRRGAFLADVCSDDPLVREEVESLLRAHQRADSFIDAPALPFDKASPRLTPGCRLGPYEVLGLLGSGGMGEVYRARDVRLGREVAIKVLHGIGSDDPERRKRFEQEARAASALNHPNLLTVFDVGTKDGIDYVVSERLEGETLRARLAAGTLTIRDALDHAWQIVSGLAAAHERGIVHRDLKPENLFLTRQGPVKILDFGLAKQITPPAGLAAMTESLRTEEGTLVGTVGYMSPEQARGLRVDARTDIWSLGVVLFEMVTGQEPFRGPTATDVLASILQREPPDLTSRSPAAPAELQWIVSKALRKDADERYQTARELLSDLKSLQQRLDLEARETSPYRGRSVRSAILMALGALVVGIGAYLTFRSSAGKAAPTSLKDPSFIQLTDQAGLEFFPSLSPDGKSFVYVSRAAGNWDIYLQRVGGRNPINLTDDSPAADTQPAFSPDGKRIAFRSEREDGGVFVMGATGESVTRVTELGYNPAWSPDGERIVVATESVTPLSSRPTKSQLWVADVTTGDKRLVGAGDALQPHWSPHGYRIAFWGRPKGGGQGEIWTLPAEGGEPIPVSPDPAMDWNPVWAPDGRFLYFSSDRGGSMNVWRAPVDEKTGRLLGSPEAVTIGGAATSHQHLGFSQDGRQLAYVALEDVQNLTRVAFDPATEKVTAGPVSVTRGSMLAGFPDPSPDGEWLAFVSMGRQRDVFVVRSDGTGLRQLTDDMHRDLWPRWSPDGRQIAFTSDRSGSTEVWVINRDGSGLRQITQRPGAHYSIWSPDGSRIAFATHRPRGGAFVLHLGENRVLLSMEQSGDASTAYEPWSWSADGKRLAVLRHLADGIHGGVGAYDLESKRYDWLTDFGDFPVWLGDSRRMLFVHEGRLFVIDSGTRKHHEVLAVPGGEVVSAALSRDDRMIYFSHVATEGDVWLMTMK
jgi:Tol biopolymer transport system component